MSDITLGPPAYEPENRVVCIPVYVNAYRRDDTVEIGSMRFWVRMDLASWRDFCGEIQEVNSELIERLSYSYDDDDTEPEEGNEAPSAWFGTESPGDWWGGGAFKPPSSFRDDPGDLPLLGTEGQEERDEAAFQRLKTLLDKTPPGEIHATPLNLNVCNGSNRHLWVDGECEICRVSLVDGVPQPVDDFSADVKGNDYPGQPGGTRPTGVYPNIGRLDD